MTVERALLCDDAKEQRLIETDSLRWRQIPRSEDRGLLSLHGLRIDAEEDIQDGLLDIIDIRGPLLHIGILHLGKDLRLIVEGDLHRVLRAVLLLQNDLLRRIQKVIVLKHHCVNGKDLRAVLPRVNHGLLIEKILLLNRLLPRPFEFLKLSLRVLRKLVSNLQVRSPVNLDFPDGDAIHHTFSRCYLHENAPLCPSSKRWDQDPLSKPGLPQCFF